MELYLQLGHGMRDHCRVLIERWGQGTVILSPRDLSEQQIVKAAEVITTANGRTLVDPQLYDPRANHARLVRHAYWPSSYNTDMLLGGADLTDMLSELKDLNDSARTSSYIVPGLYCARADDDWRAVQDSMIAESVIVLNDKKRMATVCVSGEVLRFEDQVEAILAFSENWDVNGYYVVAEHPDSAYLVDDAMWLANLLLLCAGLKLQGKEVIVGYSSHQMLCLAASNVDAIASGTYLNVRSFTPEKFRQPDEDQVSQRSTWYYCPQTLSEYKLTFLDIAFRAGLLELLRADSSLASDFADLLFSGAQPSSTQYGEQASHRHYLHCLHGQCERARRSTFRQTLEGQMIMLEAAERLGENLRRRGIFSRERAFLNVVDVNRAALASLESSLGRLLDREWI